MPVKTKCIFCMQLASFKTTHKYYIEINVKKMRTHGFKENLLIQELFKDWGKNFMLSCELLACAQTYF